MPRLPALLRGAGMIGAGNTLRSVRFSLLRAAADRRRRPRPAQPRAAVGALHDVAADELAAHFDFGGRQLQVRFPRAGQASVGWDGGLDEPSYAVVDDDADAAVPELARRHGGWLVRGPGIAVEVDDDGSLAFLDGTGATRLRQSPPQWHQDGWSMVSEHDGEGSVHGLGGRSVWDLRAGSYRCWNTDPGGAWTAGRDPLYVTTPVFLVLDATAAVHCFIDNTWDGTVEVGGGRVAVRFDGGPQRWHVSVGSLPQVLDRYTALTGRPAVPPRWALGHHQARWGYGSADAVREVWRGFREHDLPLSALHLDIDHMERYRNFTFNENFNLIEPLMREMADDGVRTVVIVDAGTAKSDDYPVYADGLRRGVFCRSAAGKVFEGVVWPGPTVFPDFTDPDARRWWGEQFGPVAKVGVAGYWHDMNEPACFAAFGDATFPLSTRHQGDGQPGDHRAFHNVYGMQMVRASYEGLLQLQPQRRPFLFSRSGWAGMQRYGGHWSGDIETEWDSLLATIHQALSYGASGVGYYGPDIGGFTGDPSPELFTRWFQLGSFLPFFRTHCAFTSPRREPWEWGRAVMARLREALRLRYRLLPYWYTLAHHAALDGAPYVRPLAWADPALRSIDDQFLVGDDILVAPVLQPGSTSRRAVLPPGGWWHGPTGQRFEATAQVRVGPADIPWFVRAGAVLPTEEGGRLVLLVAPPDGADGPGGLLLTDAGDGWQPPHRERYLTSRDGEAVVVRRVVEAAGATPYRAVEVRRIDGGPVRIVDG